jgi:hypothetical protein
MLSCAASCNYIFRAEAALIYFHNFAKLPPPQPKKKAVWKNPNEDRYCPAAELRLVSNNLVVNTEFRMTLMGQGMAPHFE